MSRSVTALTATKTQIKCDTFKSISKAFLWYYMAHTNIRNFPEPRREKPWKSHGISFLFNHGKLMAGNTDQTLSIKELMACFFFGILFN